MFAIALAYNHTDGTLLIENNEPATAQDKHGQNEQWYARVNSECECDTPEKCGDKYRSIVETVTTPGLYPRTKKQHKQLVSSMFSLRNSWAADSKHRSKLSATCDHVHMPRELLPRMGTGNPTPTDSWPYVSESTGNAVQIMRHIRNCCLRAPYSTMWQTLQQRLEQHAATGAGTIAEAIVANDYWWIGQVAHQRTPQSRSHVIR
jgi:hypothetical protein